MILGWSSGEMADARDLKSLGEIHAGSIPALTIVQFVSFKEFAMILEFGYDCYRVGGQWYMWWKGFSSWSEFRAAKS